MIDGATFRRPSRALNIIARMTGGFHHRLPSIARPALITFRFIIQTYFEFRISYFEFPARLRGLHHRLPSVAPPAFMQYRQFGMCCRPKRMLTPLAVRCRKFPYLRK